MLTTTADPGVLLIADDDEDTLILLRTLLTARGHRVLEARDGVECLAMAASGRPDLIALDLRMPRRSGFEVAAALRGDPRTAHIPLLAITAMAEATVRAQALEAGCDEVLVKPFSPAALLRQIEGLLRQSGRRPGAA